MTAIPATMLHQRDKYFKLFITFVQGQTPVTPPTSANTKENWMEEGTNHVILRGKMETCPIKANDRSFQQCMQTARFVDLVSVTY